MTPALSPVLPAHGEGVAIGQVGCTDAAEPISFLRATSAFLSAIPRDFARQHLVLSQGCAANVEQLALAPSTDPCVAFNVSVRLGCPVATFPADPEDLAAAIDRAYAAVTPRGGDVDQPDGETDTSAEVDRLLAQADRDLLSTGGKAPVVKLVDALLFDALSRSASDVHVQPVAETAGRMVTLVRYRLDGVLHTVRELPGGALTAAVISRIKVMGRMDIAERRVPQDGRATVTIGDRAIDLRISTLPTSHGERAVIRLLDNTRQLAGLVGDLNALGMRPALAEPFLERARRTHGIILVTGPTGSGKTTTLYATLRTVGSAQVNIMTIEDPIEYELSSVGLAISQSQVNLRKGVNFATGLRHILRQDPDVIMVGEIRDAETARVAIQSSLTGHLVFSTLHTNDAPGAVTRLADLGIERYLVTASLSAVLAQRLVRRLHGACLGKGCSECLGTGFRGRSGLFELMPVDEEVARLITAGSTAAEIRAKARQLGMRTLSEDGAALVQEGQTTPMEVHRVVAGAA